MHATRGSGFPRAVAALVLCAALAGCSSGSSGGQGPEQAVETFMRAVGAKDPAAACAVVASGGRPLTGTGLAQCRLGLEKVLLEVQDPGDLDKLKTAVVTGAQIDGDRATVRKDQITGVPPDYQNDIDLLRLDGRWYIDSKTAAATG